jgi:hypothetical protein
VHWGTFCDAHEARGTRVEFGRARRERGVRGEWDGRRLYREGKEKGEGEGKKGRDEQKAGNEGQLDEAVGDGDLEKNAKGRFVICDIGETLVFPYRTV